MTKVHLPSAPPRTTVLLVCDAAFDGQDGAAGVQRRLRAFGRGDVAEALAGRLTDGEQRATERRSDGSGHHAPGRRRAYRSTNQREPTCDVRI